MRPDERERRPPGKETASDGASGEVEDNTQPLTDDEIREIGFEPTWRDHRGRQWWRPLTAEVRDAIEGADARRHYDDPNPTFRIPGEAECVVCGETAEASTVGTPTCSWVCLAVVLDQLLPAIAKHLYTKGDGSGGRDSVRPITPAPSPQRVSVLPRGSFSVERALERLVDCRTVLERHGVDVRWGGSCRCPFHDDDRPSMGLYERNGKSRVHCFPCALDLDALDLEAALAGEDLRTTIQKWGSN